MYKHYPKGTVVRIQKPLIGDKQLTDCCFVVSGYIRNSWMCLRHKLTGKEHYYSYKYNRLRRLTEEECDNCDRRFTCFTE